MASIPFRAGDKEAIRAIGRHHVRVGKEPSHVDQLQEDANRTTLARFVQGGVIPVTTNAVLSEVHRTWSRPEAAEIGKLYAHVSPNYAAVVESYVKAQDVTRQSRTRP